MPRKPAKPTTSAPAAPAAQREGCFVSFPDSPFQLWQPYPPAGDQPQAIAELVEGVENGEQLERLVLLGCDCFQGYYFSKPIAVADFEKLYLSKEGVII